MMPVRSFDGAVATIEGTARKTEINVSRTAKLALQGKLTVPDEADVVALALGFTALESQCAALRAELASARAALLSQGGA